MGKAGKQDIGASADADRAGVPSGLSQQVVSGKAAHPLRAGQAEEDWLAFFEDGSFRNIGKHRDADAAEDFICNNLEDDPLYFGTRSWWIARMDAAR